MRNASMSRYLPSLAMVMLPALSGCVMPPNNQGTYRYGLPALPPANVAAFEPGPASRPIIYRNTHMPLIGPVPIRSEVVLRLRPDGTYLASATTSAPGKGSGHIEGTAIRRGAEILVTQPVSRDGPSCTLTMSPVPGRADTMRVSEGDGCNQWHGAAVEFEGTYRRAGR